MIIGLCIGGALLVGNAQTPEASVVGTVPSLSHTTPLDPRADPLIAQVKSSPPHPLAADAMVRELPPLLPKLTSSWQSNEKLFFQNLLAKEKFDALIVPFQVDGWSFDRATRSLMTAELTSAYAMSTSTRVPDPYFVARALGEGMRQIDEGDVYRLADTIGAKRIVFAYAGHDRKGKMQITVLTQDYVGNSRLGFKWTNLKTTYRYEQLAFNDESPSIQAYETILPKIVSDVAGHEMVPPMKVNAKLGVSTLPASPKDLMAEDNNPAQGAYTFLLYGLLTPKNMGRLREQFAEKAYQTLKRLSPASPEYRALRARALMGLGLRPAAIDVIGEPRNDEEKELLAALNGNLPEVRELANREQNPLKRLLEKLDANNIGTAYGVVNQKQSLAEAAGLNLPGDFWPFLVQRAFVEADRWSQFNNVGLKQLLDAELPVKGLSLEEIMRGTALLGDPDKAQLALNFSFLDHGQKFLDAPTPGSCCAFRSDRPTEKDYLELLQGIGHDNLIRYIDFQSGTQGLPQAAIRFADAIEAVYSGYPYYSLARSRVEYSMSKIVGGAEQNRLINAWHEHSFNALYWEQGQSGIANSAMDVFVADKAEFYGPLGNLYYTDIPYKPSYKTWANGGNWQTWVDNSIAALKNATTEVSVASSLISIYRKAFSGQGREDVLLRSIEGRFKGANGRNVLLSAAALDTGDMVKAEQLLRDNLVVSPGSWHSYSSLAKLLFESARVADAAKVWHDYPGFQSGSDENRVAIANYANEAGSYLYWSGHFDLAEAFYKLSVAQNSGANSEMASDMRLKLLSGDLQSAMRGALSRARRYQDSTAYRDYLSMLHAGGYSKDAWPAFHVLLKESDKPQIWESALVGHHSESKLESDLVQWIRDNKLNETEQGKKAAVIYMVRFLAMDRTPSKGAMDMVNELDQRWWKLQKSPGILLHGIEPVIDGDTTVRVRSIHASFIEAYRVIKAQDFSGAKAIFDGAAALYGFKDGDPAMHNLSYLPYYAFAAARAGDTSGVKKILGAMKPGQQQFAYHLCKAILSALSGKVDDALHEFDLAQHRRVQTEGRALLTQYTYGEILEWVYEATKDERYQALALRWAKTSEKFEPWQSWPYAIEAKLTTDPVERKRSIAMTHYLDPLSERLSAFTKSEIEDAVKEFGRSNPFLRKPTDAAKMKAI